RHHAVIGSYYQNGDIRGVRAAHTHGCERLVTRRIQEGDLLIIDGNHISTDMLGDSSGLPVNHMGMPDGIQKRGLAVVYMTHNADYRRSRYKTVLRIFRILKHLADDILFLL